MRFCIYLVDEGVISEQECVEVMRRICQRTPPLGRLILKMKLLNFSQLRGLVDKQMKVGGPLGKLAVAEGLLEEHHVCTLLERQRLETPGAAQILAEMGIVEAHTLSALHQKFLTVLE